MSMELRFYRRKERKKSVLSRECVLGKGEGYLKRLSPGACLVNSLYAKIGRNESHILQLCSRSRQQEGHICRPS